MAAKSSIFEEYFIYFKISFTISKTQDMLNSATDWVKRRTTTHPMNLGQQHGIHPWIPRGYRTSSHDQIESLK